MIKRLGARSIWLSPRLRQSVIARAAREQHVSSAVAHGTALLDRDNDVARVLVDWLRRSLLS